MVWQEAPPGTWYEELQRSLGYVQPTPLVAEVVGRHSKESEGFSGKGKIRPGNKETHRKLTEKRTLDKQKCESGGL